MNEMAMVDYLLNWYMRIMVTRKNKLNAELLIHTSQAFIIKEIIKNRFGMTIRETDTEYIAENSMCCVKVKKG